MQNNNWARKIDGHPRTRFVYMPCFHCEEAWCIKACPTGAMQRREKDGIVFVESSLCVGCKSCIAACPWGTPQWDPVTHKVVKCDYCKDRLDDGLQPACVTKCVTGCLSFGVATEVSDPRRERYARMIVAEPPERKEGIMSDQLMLPSWLDHGAATLAGAIPPGHTIAGALPAFTKALSMSPLERLQRIQESGLAECRSSGEPFICLAPVHSRTWSFGTGDRRYRTRSRGTQQCHCTGRSPMASGRRSDDCNRSARQRKN